MVGGARASKARLRALAVEPKSTADRSGTGGRRGETRGTDSLTTIAQAYSQVIGQTPWRRPIGTRQAAREKRESQKRLAPPVPTIKGNDVSGQASPRIDVDAVVSGLAR